MKHTQDDLRQMQSLPLDAKIKMTERRIQEWYDAFDGNVCISFSGGKDSTVLMDIARRLYPDIEALFVNTGLEYPSVREFALLKENVTVLRPKMTFGDVVGKYGYPLISKKIAGYVKSAKRNSNCTRAKYLRGEIDGTIFGGGGKYAFLVDAPFMISDYCCDIMKKEPLRRYQKTSGKRPIIGTKADESKSRMVDWIHRGCNAFDGEQVSRPLSFWVENDVLAYIKVNDLRIADAYGDVVPKNNGINGQTNMYDYTGDYTGCQFCTTGCRRTGCIFCLFGITKDLGRIKDLQKQEPILADYVLRGGEIGDDGMWRPSKTGMGYWFILDWLAMHGIVVPYDNAEEYRRRAGAIGVEKT